MTSTRNRFLALFLALCLGISLIPGGLFTDTAKAEAYGVVINSAVRLRKEANNNSAYWFVLPVGWVCTIRSETNAGGAHWYRVIAPHPDATSLSNARTYWGYISEAYFRPLTDEEAAAYQSSNSLTLPGVTAGSSAAAPADSSATAAPGATAAPAASGKNTAAATGTTGTITNGGTNFREGPGKKYHSMMKLDRGTVVNITSVPAGVGEDYWYGVSYDGKIGYVCSEYVRITPSGSISTVTVSPTATPTVNPGSASSPLDTTGYNAVRLNLTSAHLRTSPNGSYDRDKDWEGTGSILPLAGKAVSSGGYTWYPVNQNGKTYYVRGDCVSLVSSSSAAPAAPAEPAVVTPTEAPVVTGIVGYVTTKVSGCNLRATPAGTTIRQVGKNQTLPYLTEPVQKNGYLWYYVDANGNRGYLRSDVVNVVSGSVPSNSGAETPTPEAGATGYVKTTASDVNLRSKAGYSSILGKVAKGSVLAYYGTPTNVNGVTWYRVYHSSLGYGYLHGSYVSVVNQDGSATPTPEPTAAPTGTVISGTSTQVEASYPTLKLGSTGSDVTKLVQALKDRGYFTGTVTSRYTTAVEKAVRNFQKASGLSVDGIAGAATQHTLYGTVPIGAGDSSGLTMTLYPAEKIDWWTGGIQTLWAKGANYKVYDVKTGIVWWAHRWSGGYHIDAEPLTAADTARLCKAYGVSSSNEIKTKNLYQRRPCLVTIGDRTFACSLYGVPHDEKDQTITTNDFKGVLCIHFTNSWTHNSKKVDSLHTEAIQFAYDNAPNGHK